MKKIGIGIIGSGFARRVQIPAFLACDGVELVSIASGRLENARAAAEEFGIAHFTDNWRETVARDDVDLVCITTPPNLHREMTLAAIENDKHVLCEKPMAMNVAEAEEMTAAAEGSNRLALIDHELRFLHGRIKAFEMLRDGAVGTVRNARATFQAPHRGDPSLKWDWWSDKKQGGGALGAIGSHVIDTLQWLLGTEITEVFCQLSTNVKGRIDKTGSKRMVTSDDQTSMIVRLADGKLTTDTTAMVSVSMTEGPKYQNRTEFYGTDGTLSIDHFGRISIAKTGEADWSHISVDAGAPVGKFPDTGFSRGFMAFAPLIVEAIRSNRASIEGAATFADGLQIQRVLDAARESHSRGRSVAI